MKVTLASASPRRRELLSLLLTEFDCLATDIDETPLPSEGAKDYVLRMAVEKAAAATVMNGAVVGADTVVVLSGTILQKPVSFEDAKGMLSALSGQTHQVMTAVALMIGGRLQTVLSTTKVEFARLDESVIDAYLSTDEPWDKAGAYGIQGQAGSFVRSIEGSYSAVVGLPLCEIRELLQTAGIETRMSNPSA